MEISVHIISIRSFGKHRTHLPVRPYIAIILLRSWRLPASAVLAVPHILSLHSVDRVQPFFALPDVGTYRLGASVARTPPTAKSKYNRPKTHGFPFPFFRASSCVESSISVINIRPFGKHWTHLPVRPYIANLIPACGIGVNPLRRSLLLPRHFPLPRFGHLPIWRPPFLSQASVRLGNVGRTCWYILTYLSFTYSHLVS